MGCRTLSAAIQPGVEVDAVDTGAEAPLELSTRLDHSSTATNPQRSAHGYLDKVVTPKIVTICLAEEPSSLYVLSGVDQGWGHIQEALRDGPLDQRMFGYQPVILEKMPHWEDGDVWVTPVTVREGEGMVAADGSLVRLEQGVHYWTPELTRAVTQRGEPITTIQMHVTFRLRPDVLWSDGEALTAADSVFGFKVASDDDTPTSKALAWRTAEYLAIGALTVEWKGMAGFLNHDYVLSFAEPLPMHAYGHLRPDELLTDSLVNRQPLGWGAFRLVEWVDGSYLRLVRNERYFRSPDGLPYLDEVRFVFTETEDEALSRLTDGSCQVAVRNQWNAWETHAEYLISSGSTLRLAPQFVPGPMLEHIDFGISPKSEYHRPAGNDLLESVEMRHAIAHCLDRQALAEAVQWGKGAVAHSYVPPNHPLYAGNELDRYTFDPDQGQALLRSLGWESGNGSVMRSRDGVPLSLRYVTEFPPESSGGLRQTLAELIAADLHNCGINLIVASASSREMYTQWPEGVIFGRKFDLAEYAWLLPGEPRCELYRSDQIPGHGLVGGINSAGYSNPEFDLTCDQRLSTLDRAKAAQTHHLAQQIFAADLPSLPLFFRLRIGVARPELSGFQLDPTHPSPLWNIEAFDLIDAE